jgi:hypothetical protein
MQAPFGKRPRHRPDRLLALGHRIEICTCRSAWRKGRAHNRSQRKPPPGCVTAPEARVKKDARASRRVDRRPPSHESAIRDRHSGAMDEVGEPVPRAGDELLRVPARQSSDPALVCVGRGYSGTRTPAERFRADDLSPYATGRPTRRPFFARQVVERITPTRLLLADQPHRLPPCPSSIPDVTPSQEDPPRPHPSIEHWPCCQPGSATGTSQPGTHRIRASHRGEVARR